MLTALVGLILVVLVLIWRELDSIRDHVTSAKTGREEANKYLAQIEGGVGRIHGIILELWACPNCHGSGRVGGLFGAIFSDSPSDIPAETECATCKGTGRRSG